jgi:YHS domain-containing protein
MEVKNNMAIDPVCKMNVDEATAQLKSEYKGQTYYFCMAMCKTNFDADPEKYLGGSHPAECGCGCSPMHGH